MFASHSRGHWMERIILSKQRSFFLRERLLEWSEQQRASKAEEKSKTSSNPIRLCLFIMKKGKSSIFNGEKAK
jgi:hypothetical protein